MPNAYLARWVRDRDNDLGKALAAVDAVCDTGAFDEDESSLEVRLLEPGTHGSCGSWFADLYRVPHVYGPDDDRPEVKVASARSLRPYDDPAGMPEAVRRLARRLARMATASVHRLRDDAREAAGAAAEADALALQCRVAVADLPEDDDPDARADEECPFLCRRLVCGGDHG